MNKILKSVSIRIGLDDTDHPEIGCTTEKFDNLIGTIEAELDVHVRERRLVRLWPFAERRTRGNGALGAVVEIPEQDYDTLEEICRNWFSELLSLVEHYPPTKFKPSPCVVISRSPTTDEWYWSSVRGHVDATERYEEVQRSGCLVLSSESIWGVVGASAAVSWTPDYFSSWELIAWRFSSNIGTPRKVDIAAVNELEKLHPETFLNRDPTKGKGLIAPRTPCPVLYGIRGSSQDAVTDAHEWLQKRHDVEDCLRYATHLTNQLSDDHIESQKSGTVISSPDEIRGGHSHVFAFTGRQSVKLVAFHEGGPVNRLLRSLQPGDIVSWAGLNSPDGSIHLEKLCLEMETPRIVGRPLCCSKTMRSAGRGQGLRCSTCGKIEPKYWLSQSANESCGVVQGAWVEPSPSNRRHLARPLSLRPHGVKVIPETPVKLS